MEYDINLLAEEYLALLSEANIELKSHQIPSYDKVAYTDNEYISLITELNKDFDNVNDLTLTEQFLTKK